MRLSYALVAMVLISGSAFAQSRTPGGTPPPTGMSLAKSAAMRFPQPVLVGNLLNRDVLQPVESQNVLGSVHQVILDSSGTIDVVISYGGFLGFGTRLIAVPVDAMVLLGQVMEVVGFTPQQLRHFPTFSAGDTKPLPADTIIKVGLAKPSH